MSADILALSSSSILLLFPRKNWSTIQSKNSAYLPWCSYLLSCFLTPSLRKESNPLWKFSMAQQKRGYFKVSNFKQKGCNCKFESLQSGPRVTLRPQRMGYIVIWGATLFNICTFIWKYANIYSRLSRFCTARGSSTRYSLLRLRLVSLITGTKSYVLKSYRTMWSIHSNFYVLQFRPQ